MKKVLISFALVLILAIPALARDQQADHQELSWYGPFVVVAVTIRQDQCRIKVQGIDAEYPVADPDYLVAIITSNAMAAGRMVFFRISSYGVISGVRVGG